MLKLKCGCGFYGVQALYFIHGSRRLLLYSTSSSSATEAKSSSSLANYLVESLGFSSKQSLSTSTKLFKRRKPSRLKNVSGDCKIVLNLNLLINFFKQNGFDESQIRKLIVAVPQIALSNVDKTLKPKIELLREIGLSGSDLSRTIILRPSLLCMRLNPVIQTLRQVLNSDDNVCKALSSQPYIYCGGYKYLISNVELLKNCGIPNDIIQKHVMQDPQSFTVRPIIFEDNLIKVEKKLGISPTSNMFLYVFRILRRHSEKNIESKFQVFKSFGWTQSDFLELMRRVPGCLGLSKATIKKKLGFLMSELGYQPAYLISRFGLMTSSLEKRVMPRHKVLLVLKENGLINMNYTLWSAVWFKESQFVNKFVLPYEEVHEVYAKHVGLSVKLLTQGRENNHSKL